MNLEAIVSIVVVLLTAAQVWSAVQASKDGKSRDRLEDANLSLGVHADLTAREVIELLQRPTEGRTASDLAYLRAIHERGKAKLDALSETLKAETRIAGMLDQALDEVENAFSSDGETAGADDSATVKLGTDRTKYSWDGAGRFTKIETINRVAAVFAQRRGITTREGFETEFGDQIQKATRGTAGVTFHPEGLLEESEAGELELDGTRYKVEWGCGFGRPRAIGTVIHKPLIEYFKAGGYPVAAV